MWDGALLAQGLSFKGQFFQWAEIKSITDLGGNAGRRQKSLFL